MTLLSVLEIVAKPDARMAQQGSKNWLLTGRGTTSAKTSMSAATRRRRSHTHPAPRFTLSFAFCKSSLIVMPPFYCGWSVF